MAPHRNRKSILSAAATALVGYDRVLTDLVQLLASARHATARAVNAAMTATYWQVGRRIVEWEQGGQARAGYADALLDRLSTDLTQRVGRGFSVTNLRHCRWFYLGWPSPPAGLVAMPRPSTKRIQQTLSVELRHGHTSIQPQRFPLPWSHYIRLLAVKDAPARAFYETEALRGGWSVRQLDRQINSLFYERTALSRNKAALLTQGAQAKPEDFVAPEEELKDPFVLEFLGLKDEYSETDLEDALLSHLHTFLLELGDDFAFIGRQRRLRIGDQWFRVDLLFFHRRLRCLVVIDLKVGPFTHADAGQMHLYLNYAAEHWTRSGENPPVGLILCAHKDSAVAHYALDNLPTKVLAAEYKVALPDEATLVRELAATRKRLETRALTRGRPARR